MPTISDLNAQAAEALGRLKPNERKLLAGMALVALALGPIKAAGMMQDASARNTEVQAELEKVKLAAQRGQGGVGGQVADLRSEVRSWSWQAETLDVGKVLIQDRIADMADQAGLTEVEVKLIGDATKAGDVQLVPMELTANFSWSGLSSFLTAMDGGGKGFVLDGVTMPDSDKPRLKVNLRAPLVLSQPITPASRGKS